MTVAGLGVVIGVAWGVVHLALGKSLAAMITGIYGLLTVIKLALFAATKRYRLFQTSQLAFYLFLPFALQLILGGFVGASAVVVFALFAPFGALVMRGRQSAARLMCLCCAPGCQSDPGAWNDDQQQPQPPSGGMAVRGEPRRHLPVHVRDDALLRRSEGSRSGSSGIGTGQIRALAPQHPPRGGGAGSQGNRTTEARFYESATVLFADQVGFTKSASEHDAEEVVRVLNDVFNGFVGIAASYGVEEIRTIGDAFMAVAGVPIESDDHTV